MPAPNQEWIDKHSVTCPICGGLADRRESIETTQDEQVEDVFGEGQAHEKCFDQAQRGIRSQYMLEYLAGYVGQGDAVRHLTGEFNFITNGEEAGGRIKELIETQGAYVAYESLVEQRSSIRLLGQDYGAYEALRAAVLEMAHGYVGNSFDFAGRMPRSSAAVWEGALRDLLDSHEGQTWLQSQIIDSEENVLANSVFTDAADFMCALMFIDLRVEYGLEPPDEPDSLREEIIRDWADTKDHDPEWIVEKLEDHGLDERADELAKAWNLWPYRVWVCSAEVEGEEVVEEIPDDQRVYGPDDAAAVFASRHGVDDTNVRVRLKEET